MFGPGMPFHLSLMFVDKTKSTPKRGETETFPTWVGSRSYPQTLDLGGKPCQVKTHKLIVNFHKIF
jgi:hypothetical protein